MLKIIIYFQANALDTAPRCVLTIATQFLAISVWLLLSDKTLASEVCSHLCLTPFLAHLERSPLEVCGYSDEIIIRICEKEVKMEALGKNKAWA